MEQLTFTDILKNVLILLNFCNPLIVNSNGFAQEEHFTLIVYTIYNYNIMLLKKKCWTEAPCFINVYLLLLKILTNVSTSVHQSSSVLL